MLAHAWISQLPCSHAFLRRTFQALDEQNKGLKSVPTMF